LGVGVGNSVYYMHLYEFKMGIVNFGDTLSLGIFPQNLYACVFAEQGLIGGCALLFFLLAVVKELWKYRNEKPYGRMFFVGGLFNVAVTLSNPLVYALFIWVFLVLALGYNKYIHEKDSNF
jgi:O-antigen ligase